MKIHNRILRKNEKGATAVYAAVVLALLLGFAALGVDVNYLYGVRNELHNAADAGALAGAQELFNSEGELTPDAAITEATRIASANKTGNQAVSVKTVEIGQWSFSPSREFKPSSDPELINAVKVWTERSDTPSFFAKILGFDRFFVNAKAVAYIGCPRKFKVDEPIAICEESIIDAEGDYSCNMGRMLNSGTKTESSNSAGWTNFTQQECETATPSTVKPLICDGKSTEVETDQEIGATGGTDTSILQKLYPCWLEESTYEGEEKTKNWNMTLPVIECPKNNVAPCPKLVGAVNVDVIWITDWTNENLEDAPTEMTILDNDGNEIDSWSNSDPDGLTRWISFVDHFHLENVNGPPSADNDFQDYKDMYQKKNIYFLPSCEKQVPIGSTGGECFGIMAKIPKLVE